MKGKCAFVLRAALAAALLLFLVLSPAPLARGVGLDRYRAFFEKPATEWYGRITIWHIVEFKPYQGSGTKFLRDRAEAFCTSRPGVHFEVIGMTAEKALERLARGETPDGYSFPSGFLYPERLQPMTADGAPKLRAGVPAAAWEGTLYALPYLQSCHVLLVNTQLLYEAGLEMPKSFDASLLRAALALRAKTPQLAMPETLAAERGLSGALAEYADFTAGKAMLAVSDLRAYGALQRAEEQNLLVEALPVPGFFPLVQYLGAARDTDEKRAALIAAFAQTLLTQDEQRRLPALGALPVAAETGELAYSEPALAACLAALPETRAPEPFLYERHRAALAEDARAALSGEAAAKAAFFERLSVVLGG